MCNLRTRKTPHRNQTHPVDINTKSRTGKCLPILYPPLSPLPLNSPFGSALGWRCCRCRLVSFKRQIEVPRLLPQSLIPFHLPQHVQSTIISSPVCFPTILPLRPNGPAAVWTIQPGSLFRSGHVYDGCALQPRCDGFADLLWR